MTHFSASDIEKIYALAEELTGTCQQGRFRREVLSQNIRARIDFLNLGSLDDYVKFALANLDEKSKMVSALTIHTTSWFRELPHFERLEKHARDYAVNKNSKTYKLWSAASSTGEEVYTAGLVLEAIRHEFPGFQYELFATDLDPVSVAQGLRAVYPLSAMECIPPRYHRFVWVGSGKTAGFFTLDKEIRKRTLFAPNSLSADVWVVGNRKFDFVMCRNVLIYFSPEKVLEIVARLAAQVGQGGVLCLGHSEVQESAPKSFSSLGQSCYGKGTSVAVNRKSIGDLNRGQVGQRILIVDDSKVVRKMLKSLLQPMGYLVLEAEAAAQADSILAENPPFDLVTLDLHMPGEEGHVWLKRKRLEGLKTPVIVVTDADPKEAQIVLNAMHGGAQDFKFKSDLSKNPEEFKQAVLALIKSGQSSGAGKVLPLTKTKSSIEVFRPELILVGASTGGPEVLCHLLKNIPNAKSCPPCFVVQHIPSAFALPFAERLAKNSGLEFHEPVDGEELREGALYVALGDYHLGVSRRSGKLHVLFGRSEAMHGHRPAVDFLFNTAAQANVRGLAALMTGMGRDGADGMLALHKTGLTLTLAQDEQSCVVYGMPKEAIQLGGVQMIGDPQQLREVMERAMSVETSFLKTG